MPLPQRSLRRKRSQKVLRAARCRRQSSHGFTLIELLLTVILLLLLVGALAFNFSSLLRDTSLEEGTARIETLIRLARAHAANTGRTVQIVFASSSGSESNAPPGQVRVTWEREPLTRPGAFEDMAEFRSLTEGIEDLVQIDEARLLEPAFGAARNTMNEEFDIEAFDNSDSAPPMAAITFYPDGSSDSVEILLTARASEKKQQMAVRVAGIIGAVSHRLIESTDGDVSPFDDEQIEAAAAVASK